MLSAAIENDLSLLVAAPECWVNFVSFNQPQGRTD